jgi:hypothetical protein
VPRVDSCVGIDKEQNVSARRVRSRVPGGGNLTAIDRNNLRVGTSRYFRSRVGGSIIDDNDFVFLPRACRSGSNRS